MYRILSASKDGYITNKYINGKSKTSANTGFAGTVDLFSLYDETFVIGVTSSIREVSRGLIQFDYSEIADMVANDEIDLNDSSFRCYLNMKDVYGGQTTPSNYSLAIFPLSKSWDEGEGMDIIQFRDIDACNFVTASTSNGTATLWSETGANKSGSLGDSDIDIISDFMVTQSFVGGDEDLLVDVTSIVSSSIVGALDNHGFRVSFAEEEENDSVTYFVKRLGTRHAVDKDLRPRLLLKYDNQIIDDSGIPQFNITQSFFVYNNEYDTPEEYENFTYQNQEITGPNSLKLTLFASRSVSFLTTSWSTSHSQSITYNTRSMSYFSQSFLASQYQDKPGIYFANTYLDSETVGDELNTFLSGNQEQTFKAQWGSLDDQKIFATRYLKYKTSYGSFSNSQNRNWIVNITNMKSTYVSTEVIRLRVFVQDYNNEQIATKVPIETKSVILKNMQWRLRTAFDNKVCIPFDETATKLSCDSEGMYFDLYIKDLDINEVYQIDLLINSDTGKDYYIENTGFRFKVIK